MAIAAIAALTTSPLCREKLFHAACGEKMPIGMEIADNFGLESHHKIESVLHRVIPDVVEVHLRPLNGDGALAGDVGGHFDRGRHHAVERLSHFGAMMDLFKKPSRTCLCPRIRC